MEIKIFYGGMWGTFTAQDTGQILPYCNAFCGEEFPGSEHEGYHFVGMRAMKYKCVNADVFKGIEPGMMVECFFDSRGRISRMVPVK